MLPARRRLRRRPRRIDLEWKHHAVIPRRHVLWRPGGKQSRWQWSRCFYGVVSGTSIWYPINLLASGFFPNAMVLNTTELAALHLRALLTAGAIHLVTSLLVGLLYGAMLPVLARRPILLGGLIAPVFWSGLLLGILNIVNPLLQRRIDWVLVRSFADRIWRRRRLRGVAAGNGSRRGREFRWLSAWESNRPELSPGRTRSTVREEVQAGRGAADNGRCCGCV